MGETVAATSRAVGVRSPEVLRRLRRDRGQTRIGTPGQARVADGASGAETVTAAAANPNTPPSQSLRIGVFVRWIAPALAETLPPHSFLGRRTSRHVSSRAHPGGMESVEECPFVAEFAKYE